MQQIAISFTFMKFTIQNVTMYDLQIYYIVVLRLSLTLNLKDKVKYNQLSNIFCIRIRTVIL